MDNIQPFIDQILTWVQTQPGIQAIALVGSYARGEARPDSDIDLVLLCNDPASYVLNPDWAKEFGPFDGIGLEDYGMVQSVRVFYKDGPEVEFGWTTPDWASLPLNEGTREVISHGMVVVFERRPLLSPLLRLS